MSQSHLLVVYQAMPSDVLKERMALMQSVLAEREQESQPGKASYMKQVAKKEAPEHLDLEPMSVGAMPPSDGSCLDLRGRRL